mgnify:CR=1 FL=1
MYTQSLDDGLPISLRDDLDADFVQRVEHPMRTGAQQALELAVAEVEAHFVAANLESSHHDHCFLPFRRVDGFVIESPIRVN